MNVDYLLNHREKHEIVRLVGQYERTETAQFIAERIRDYLLSLREADPGDLGQDEQRPLKFGSNVEPHEWCKYVGASGRYVVAVYVWLRRKSSLSRVRVCWLYYDTSVDFVCFLWDDA